MRLLERKPDGHLVSCEYTDRDVPAYAILSHTWLTDNNEEVSFQDVEAGTSQSKLGWKKIEFCADKAAADDLRYFWIDTCCIKKSSDAELSESLNSMYRWYQRAENCYVYLSDVSTRKRKMGDVEPQDSWEQAFRKSKWFTRGWTLQELLAPRSVKFFSKEGELLGDKQSLEQQIHEVTGIPILALRGSALSQFSAEQRFSWAKSRQTTREEDRAYSLLGVFEISMPVIYGEGRTKAVRRLEKEIGLEIDLADRLPRAAEAPFNSYTKQHEPNCLPDTRVDLLQTIYKWADGQDERCLFWLNGLAGTGKSTIARTVARNYSKQERLGASFFFSRGGGDVGHAGKFFTSIAIQLAEHVPTLHKHICDAITERRRIASLSLKDQWLQLVLKPLSKLSKDSCQPQYVVVIDALDECDNDDDIRLILHLLAEARSLKSVRLRVFLTSRPEIPIRYGFYKIPDTEHKDFVLHNVPRSTVDHDISIFLENRLELIREERSLDPSWPGEEVIRDLVQIASGLFIWAATACRFIRAGPFADERLHTLLQNGTSPTTGTPEEHLNGIYLTILRKSIQSGFSREDKKRFCDMLKHFLGSVVTLLSPLSVDSLSKLLANPKQRVIEILKDLHAILDIPKDQTGPLRLHHPSFRDFLLDQKRCTDSYFWVDEKQAHQTMAESCIRLMSTHLKQDIYKLGAPGVLITEVKNSRVLQYLPPEVQYACLYWVEHLQKSSGELNDNDEVHRFLQTHFLHWLEALSWMQRLSEGIVAIHSLESIALACDCPQLYAFIHDMKRFALYGRPAIEQAPLQTYCSALVFAPMKSYIKKQFIDKMPTWMQRLPKAQEDWSALLQTLEGHTDSVNSVAFSPDGALLASASYDKTVRLWDAATGAALHTLEGHTNSVWSVAFSPNGALLASASGDNTVRLWDAATGAALHTLEGHTNSVKSVAFSPNGELLASASHDKTVRLWDATTGAVVHTLEGHKYGVTSVAFSPNGALLASASYDKTVRLWDAAMGAAVHTLEGHTDWVKLVAFSPNGALLASASSDITVRLWDAATGAAVRTLEGHTSSVTSVAFSPNGALLALASGVHTVRLWDAATGAAVHTLKGHTGSVNSVVFSPNGALLALASGDKTVRLWDAATGAAVLTLEGHKYGVNSVVFSPNGALLASASGDNTVRLWDVATGAAVHTLEGHTDWVKSVAFSPNSALLASASGDHTVRLWDAATGAALKMIALLPFVNTLSFSLDRPFLETDQGLLHLEGLQGYYTSHISAQSMPQPSIFLDQNWVLLNKERLLWLPVEYRGSCFAIRGKVLALGQRDGRVTVIEVR